MARPSLNVKKARKCPWYPSKIVISRVRFVDNEGNRMEEGRELVKGGEESFPIVSSFIVWIVHLQQKSTMTSTRSIPTKKVLNIFAYVLRICLMPVTYYFRCKWLDVFCIFLTPALGGWSLPPLQRPGFGPGNPNRMGAKPLNESVSRLYIFYFYTPCVSYKTSLSILEEQAQTFFGGVILHNMA